MIAPLFPSPRCIFFSQTAGIWQRLLWQVSGRTARVACPRAEALAAALAATDPRFSNVWLCRADRDIPDVGRRQRRRRRRRRAIQQRSTTSPAYRYATVSAAANRCRQVKSPAAAAFRFRHRPAWLGAGEVARRCRHRPRPPRSSAFWPPIGLQSPRVPDDYLPGSRHAPVLPGYSRHASSSPGPAPRSGSKIRPTRSAAASQLRDLRGTG
jgi:hypothetical protein